MRPVKHKQVTNVDTNTCLRKEHILFGKRKANKTFSQTDIIKIKSVLYLIPLSSSLCNVIYTEQ
jgi:hypothetical protein